MRQLPHRFFRHVTVTLDRNPVWKTFSFTLKKRRL